MKKETVSKLDSLRDGLRVTGYILFGAICLVALVVSAVCVIIFLTVMFAATRFRPLNMGDGQLWSWKKGFYQA
jgi:hypothetical protein